MLMAGILFLIVVLLPIVLLFSLGYCRAPLWGVTLFVGISIAAFFKFHLIALILIAIPAVLINIVYLRRALISKPIFKWFKKSAPSISETERTVLEAGNVWWEGKLFCGSPDWEELLAMKKPSLTDEEQLFLDEQVETLCHLIDQIGADRDTYGLSPALWDYLKKEKFFGMVIEKEHGGLGFSAQAHSAVIKKIGSRSLNVAVVTMVPNSLGPAELISHYGTAEQKSHYLPRLAKGEELPCFGLTALHAGSDATSITDSGIVMEGTFKGKKVLGIQLNFDKRYITLAPIATLLGLAFKLYDPHHLLGEQENLGINIAMIPLPFKGVEHNRRHWPARLSFPNGPVRGKDVFIPLEYLLGELGQGWKMLVERLSIGRSISLPALSSAAASVCYVSTGAYAQIRQQFSRPISSFEAVREALSRIAGYTYLVEATRELTALAVDLGVCPGIASAIAKSQMTEIQRKIINHAMDIHAGKAVQAGPRNYLIEAYCGLPVGITVEGANILTRGLIIFGQGAMRCHPYFLDEIKSAEDPDFSKGLKKFDEALWGHLGFVLSNGVRTVVMGLTGGLLIRAPVKGPLARYYRALSRMSTALAFVADVTASLLGSDLKRRESLSARLGDVLSQLYLASAVLKYYEDQGAKQTDLPMVQWCLEECLSQMQIAFDDFIANFPNRILRPVMARWVFPWGRSYRVPSDKHSEALLESMLTHSDFRTRLIEKIYIGNHQSPLHCLEQAFQAVLSTAPLEKKLRDAMKQGSIPLHACFEEQLMIGAGKGLFSPAEMNQLETTRQLVEAVLQVDEFNLKLSEVLNA